MRFLLLATVVACGGAPKPEPKPEPEPVAHGPDARSIDGAIKAHQPQILACYQQGLVDDPEAAGEVVVAITIDDDGHVSDVATMEEESTLGLPAVSACIEAEIRSIAFPPGKAVVHYPFRFDAG